jgi:hypothetical protein
MSEVKQYDPSDQAFQKSNFKKKSSKALLKAVEIAGDIISGRVTFVGNELDITLRCIQTVAQRGSAQEGGGQNQGI